MIVTRTMHWNRPTNWATQSHLCNNKANLRDLIAATGLVILLKFDPNHPFFSPCYLEIWWMNLENNRAPLLFYIKLCASFQSHGWIRTGVSGNTPFWVKIGNFLSRVTLKFDGWPWKTIGHLFYVFFQLCVLFHSHQWIQTRIAVRKCPIWDKIDVFCPVWPWNLTDDLENHRVPLLCYFKLCASFRRHWWI